MPAKHRTRPKAVPGFGPPAAADDRELHRVHKLILGLDPTGSRFANSLRDAIDQLLDGQRTGRWDWNQLRKTEKTHMGTVIEIKLHHDFNFGDGIDMDYLIAEIEVDCKFSQTMGGWEMPPEAVGHLCLVVTANDDAALWSAGLIRLTEGLLREGGNRDRKRRLTPEGESSILWLHQEMPLPPNLLLHLDATTRNNILDHKSGQRRINELFRAVPCEIIRRAVVLTVAQQEDSLKRARDARNQKNLGSEGFLVLGHQDDDPRIAKELGLPVPEKGQFVSVRVCPASADATNVATIAGGQWRIARPSDRATPAPKTSRSIDPKRRGVNG